MEGVRIQMYFCFFFSFLLGYNRYSPIDSMYSHFTLLLARYQKIDSRPLLSGSLLADSKTNPQTERMKIIPASFLPGKYKRTKCLSFIYIAYHTMYGLVLTEKKTASFGCPKLITKHTADTSWL